MEKSNAVNFCMSIWTAALVLNDDCSDWVFPEVNCIFSKWHFSQWHDFSWHRFTKNLLLPQQKAGWHRPPLTRCDHMGASPAAGSFFTLDMGSCSPNEKTREAARIWRCAVWGQEEVQNKDTHLRAWCMMYILRSSQPAIKSCFSNLRLSDLVMFSSSHFLIFPAHVSRIV